MISMHSESTEYTKIANHTIRLKRAMWKQHYLRNDRLCFYNSDPALAAYFLLKFLNSWQARTKTTTLRQSDRFRTASSYLKFADFLSKEIAFTVLGLKSIYKNVRKTTRGRSIPPARNTVQSYVFLHVPKTARAILIQRFTLHKLTLNIYKITIQHWKILECTNNALSYPTGFSRKQELNDVSQ